jgi:hypothetical protein
MKNRVLRRSYRALVGIRERGEASIALALLDDTMRASVVMVKAGSPGSEVGEKVEV